MNVYITAHEPYFLACQVAAIERHCPGATVHVVATANASKAIRDVASIQLPYMVTPVLVPALLPLVSDGPGMLIEWDVVPSRTVSVENAVAVADGFGEYPSVLKWADKSALNLGYRVYDSSPFVVPDYSHLPQVYVQDGCGAAANFQSIGSEFLHFHNHADGRRPMKFEGDRLACWQQLMDEHGAARPGLGDMVAAGLSAIGITKERAQAVANAVGVKDCGCKTRQAKLNELGRKFGIG